MKRPFKVFKSSFQGCLFTRSGDGDVRKIIRMLKRYQD